jgi:hypothetical protein
MGVNKESTVSAGSVLSLKGEKKVKTIPPLSSLSGPRILVDDVERFEVPVLPL